jgi:chemotaxis protein MotB
LARQQALADLALVQGQVAALSEADAQRLSEAAAAEALRRRLAGIEAELSETERRRLAEAAAAEALRQRLANADSELTAMTLALEEQRRRAEDTLTLLAAAQQARAGAEAERDRQLTDLETRAALLRLANQELAEARAASTEDQRALALLNEQVEQLRRQVAGLQQILGESQAREAAAGTQISALGSDLNAALARVAAEERRRRELEEAERLRLQAEAAQLERYRSEFFGQMRQILAGRQGVQVVGDRFVFSSEVLFEPGSADLSDEGRLQIANVGAILLDAAQEIPESIDWVLRVDGHTDDAPIRAGGRYASNWELSQARALSVVLYMVDELGFPPERLAATGFGEFRPVVPGSDPVSRAQNRRIELKLTER